MPNYNPPECFWITGLPAAGKSTVGRALVAALNAHGFNAYLLDGDELRQTLCSDLGLSDSDRAENVRRVSAVAQIFSQAGVIAVCALVSPFASGRNQARALFSPGKFCEIYLSTPLEICQQRDPKGLYARALSGDLRCLTGVDAPYEPPESAEFNFNTNEIQLNEIIKKILV